MRLRPLATRLPLPVILVVWMAAGCGSNAATPPAASPSAGPAASTAPGAAASSTKSPARLRPLFRDAAHPTLFGPAAPLSLGMPIADARRSVPTLFGHDLLRAPGFDDIAMSAHADAYGRLGSLTMAIGCDTALRDVTDLWGVPSSGDDPRAKEKLYWWFDPAARLRATLVVPYTPETCTLVLDRYLPLAELMGPGDAKFGFEREPLAGMSSSDVARVFNDYLSDPSDDPCKSQILVLPPVEYDRVFTRVRLNCRATNVGSFDIVVNYGANENLRTQIVDWLSRKFGRPGEATAKMLVFPPSTRGVRLVDSASMKDLTIEVSRP